MSVPSNSLLLSTKDAIMPSVCVLWLRREPQQLRIQRRMPHAVLRQGGARKGKIVESGKREPVNTEHHSYHVGKGLLVEAHGYKCEKYANTTTPNTRKWKKEWFYSTIRYAAVVGSFLVDSVSVFYTRRLRFFFLLCWIFKNKLRAADSAITIPQLDHSRRRILLVQ